MSDGIKFKPTTFKVIILLVVVLFGSAMCLSNQSSKKHKIADYKTAIAPVTLNGDENFGSLRATIFYGEKAGIVSNARLISNEFVDKKYWKVMDWL